MNGKQNEALGLLLEAVRLDPKLADAHASLAEVYAIRGDSDAAWKHARAAEENGEPRAVEMLKRHAVR
jgi:Tfp pilus assembly protein PilF